MTTSAAHPGDKSSELHYCIRCGREFKPAPPGATICPECSGAPNRVEPASTPTRVGVSGGLPAAPPSPSQGVPTRMETAPAAGPAEWKAGDILLDLYEVKSVLGQGGMGKVYRVHHKGWNLDLAVKSPSAFRSDEQKQTFISEAETWVNLGLHPHIVTCYYVRNINDIPRVFAECVEGGSLKQWIAERKLTSLDQALDVAIQFAWGLAYAHEQGLAHRDVKPDNVLMTPDGAAKVTDFGLAKARGGMTPAYCSPEQAEFEAQVNAKIPAKQRTQLTTATDIWSWSLSVLEMFAGRPFWVKPEAPDYAWGQVAPDALEDYLSGELEGTLIPAMPPALAELLRQCFRGKPDERPKDMLEVAAQVLAIYQQEVGRSYPRQMPKAVELRADSLNNKALSLMDLTRPDDAVATWQKALSADPLHPEATFNLGQRQWRAAEITDEELLRRLGAVREAQSASWKPHYLIGLVLMESGDWAAARDSLARANELEGGIREVKAALERTEELAPETRTQSLTGAWAPVAMLPDGRHLIASSPPSFWLWNLDTGQPVKMFRGHKTRLTALLIARGGKQVISVSEDGERRSWDIETGECTATLPNHPTTFALSRDGERLAEAYLQSIRVRQFSNLAIIAEITGEMDGFIGRLSLSADGRYALTAEERHGVRFGEEHPVIGLWDLRKKKRLRDLARLEWSDGATAVAFTLDGQYALSGHSDGQIRLWRLSGDAEKADFKQWAPPAAGEKPVPVTKFLVVPDGRLVVSAASDGTVRVWEIATGRCFRTFEKQDGPVEDVVLSPGGRHLITATSQGKLNLWFFAGIGARPAEWVLSRPQDVSRLSQIAETYARYIAALRAALEQSGHESAIDLLRQARGLPGYERDPAALDLLHELGQKRGWRTKLLATDRVRETGGSAFYLLPHRNQFAEAWGSGIEVRDLASGEVAVDIDLMSQVAALAFPRRRQAAPAERDRMNALDSIVRQDVYAVAVTSDGRYAVTGAVAEHDEGIGRVWDLESGECLHDLTGQSGRISAVAITADDRYAITGSRPSSDSGGGKPQKEGGTLCLWEIKTGRRIHNFNRWRHPVGDLILAPDGRTVVISFPRGGSAMLVDVQNGKTQKEYPVTGVAHAATATPDGSHVLVAGSVRDQGRVWAFDLVTGRLEDQFDFRQDIITAIALTADCRFVGLGYENGWVELRNWQTKAVEYEARAHTERVSQVKITEDGRYWVTSSRNEGHVWKLDWEYEFPASVEWATEAEPFIGQFIARHSGQGLFGRTGWKDEMLEPLCRDLQRRGYGWIRPEGLREKLKAGK